MFEYVLKMPLPKKNITSHIVYTKKQIFIRNNNGFGNKIFDMILAVYLFNLYEGKCVVNFINYYSKHEDNNDPKIDVIFNKSLLKINFMSLPEYKISPYILSVHSIIAESPPLKFISSMYLE